MGFIYFSLLLTQNRNEKMTCAGQPTFVNVRFLRHQSGISRQGWGEMRWANGTLYGPGNIFIYSQGDRYFGQWIRNKQEGMYLTLVELSSKKISKCINWMKTFFQRKVKLTRRR